MNIKPTYSYILLTQRCTKHANQRKRKLLNKNKFDFFQDNYTKQWKKILERKTANIMIQKSKTY
jgi:hypothetical protein